MSGLSLVLVAARVEATPLMGELGGTDPRVVIAGVGTAGDPGARTALAGPPGTVLNLGFAGSLSADVSPGDVVITSHWCGSGPASANIQADSALRNLVDSWLPDDIERHHGPGITVDRPFHDEARAAEIHRETGALTVEMEGARWASIAREAGWRFAALRIISDRADLRLPLPRHRLLRPDGGLRLRPWIGALGSRQRSLVGEWRALRRAQADWRRAMATLTAVSAAIAPHLNADDRHRPTAQ